MIDPHGEPDDVINDVPGLSVAEVEKRIGARKRERTKRAQEIAPTRVRAVRANRRVVLWRDSATILIFVVVALLAARFMLPDRNGVATGSQTPGPSEISIGSSPVDTGFHFSALPTIGPPVDPSSAINATPTPIPLVTRAPRPSVSPSPTPTKAPGPSKTPGPSNNPTPTPTTPPTPPTASFTWGCDPGGGTVVDYTSTSTAGSAGGPLVYEWDFDDGFGFTSGAATPVHTYDALHPAPWSVILKVTDASGQFDVTLPQTVSCP